MVSNRLREAIPLLAKNPDIKTGFLKRFPIDLNLRQEIGERLRWRQPARNHPVILNIHSLYPGIHQEI